LHRTRPKKGHGPIKLESGGDPKTKTPPQPPRPGSPGDQKGLGNSVRNI
jgi:hypothetical protein